MSAGCWEVLVSVALPGEIQNITGLFSAPSEAEAVGLGIAAAREKYPHHQLRAASAWDMSAWVRRWVAENPAPASAEPPTNQVAPATDAAQVDGKVPGMNLKDQSQ